MIAVRFTGVRNIGIGTRRFAGAGSFLELIQARIAEGVETGFTFLTQGIAAPVQVCHDGILVLMSCNQKTIAGFGEGRTLREKNRYFSRAKNSKKDPVTPVPL